MTELKKSHNGNLVTAFQKSEVILQRAVALPISTIALEETIPGRIKCAILKALNK